MLHSSPEGKCWFNHEEREMIILSLGPGGFRDRPSACKFGNVLARKNTETTQVIGTNLVIVEYGHE